MKKTSILTFALIFVMSINNIFAQTTGTFTDSRDGKTYKTVKIGNQVWMAENLAYTPTNGNYWPYDNSQNNVAKYGYLYDWETAKNIIPKGWHLPTKEEFEILFNNYGGIGEQAYEALLEGGESNFNVLFSGWRLSNGIFSTLGLTAGLWSATEKDESDVWHCILNIYIKRAYMNEDNKDTGLSVRLLKD